MMNGHVHDPHAKHAAEMRRCLAELDIDGMRRLDAHLYPHLREIRTDSELLFVMHTARVQMKSITERAKQYSRDWLAERDRRMRQMAVGVAVKAQGFSDSEHALNVRDAMSQSVMESIKAGIDIDADADEVKRRMQIARKRA